MIDTNLILALLNSLKDPFTFVDTDHIIRYMNRAACDLYEKGESLLGTSALDCHNQRSQTIMLEIFSAMYKGLEERLISEGEDQRIFMRAVRDLKGKLLGYYERYEPVNKN